MSAFVATFLFISALFICARGATAPIGARLQLIDWALVGVFLTSLVMGLITNP